MGKIRKILALLLAICVFTALVPAVSTGAEAAWDGSAALFYDGGSGTFDDPYIISTAGELALFRDQVNSGDNSICAKVVKDIDLGGVPWTPIGLTQTGYNGVFDGGGWAIKNLKLSTVSDPISVKRPTKTFKMRVAGLFGIIGTEGFVKYVNLDGSVTGSISNTNSSYSIYIGSVTGFNFGTVEECFATCTFTDLTISNNNYIGIGGITGDSSGPIKNCYYVGTMKVTLTATKTGLNHYVGGIAGYSGAEISNCYSAASVTVSSSAKTLYKGAITGVSYYLSDITNSFYDNQVNTWTSNVTGATYSSAKGQNPDGCGGTSTANMKSWWMPGKLGDVYRYDTDKVNSGYPILAVMTYGELANEHTWYTDELESYDIDEATLNELVPTSLWNKDLTKNVTRTEFAGIAVNLYETLSGYTAEPVADNPFSDTSNDDILKAYNLGITNGVSATQFDPYSYISRQDMATMLTRVYKKLYFSGWTLENDGNYTLAYDMPAPFADDALIAGYARDSVYFMYSQGILKGTNGYFYPYAAATNSTVGYATREQAILTSVRYYSCNN